MPNLAKYIYSCVWINIKVYTVPLESIIVWDNPFFTSIIYFLLLRAYQMNRNHEPTRITFWKWLLWHMREYTSSFSSTFWKQLLEGINRNPVLKHGYPISETLIHMDVMALSFCCVRGECIKLCMGHNIDAWWQTNTALFDTAFTFVPPTELGVGANSHHSGGPSVW